MTLYYLGLLADQSDELFQTYKLIQGYRILADTGVLIFGKNAETYETEAFKGLDEEKRVSLGILEFSILRLQQ